ncbi:hypothetical protein PG987_014989 [Apiospora arundinis]
MLTQEAKTTTLDSTCNAYTAPTHCYAVLFTEEGGLRGNPREEDLLGLDTQASAGQVTAVALASSFLALFPTQAEKRFAPYGIAYRMACFGSRGRGQLRRIWFATRWDWMDAAGCSHPLDTLDTPNSYLIGTPNGIKSIDFAILPPKPTLAWIRFFFSSMVFGLSSATGPGEKSCGQNQVCIVGLKPTISNS